MRLRTILLVLVFACVSAATAAPAAAEPPANALVAGRASVTTPFGRYFIDVLVISYGGHVGGFYRHSDAFGNFSVVEARCLRLSPGRAVIGGITVRSSITGQVGRWAALAIDDRRTGQSGPPDRVISGVQGPQDGPSCPIPFSPDQIAGPWDEVTGGDLVIFTGFGLR